MRPAPSPPRSVALSHPRTFALRLAASLPLLLLAACGSDEPDAYGNFEATETVVSAEASGRLLEFVPARGMELPAGAVVGLVDTATLALQREELSAQRRAAETRTTEAAAQISVLQAQLATARSELGRTERLYRAEAATAQALERARGEVRVLQERIEAARAQSGMAREEVGGTEARRAQVEERLRKSRIVNPVAGTVLTTYARAGEFVQAGQPLYEVADLDTLTLRAYVTGAQLPEVRLGQRVVVRVDGGEDGDGRAIRGTVTWIAPEAEFTPTPIQTREERVDLVYAIEIRVPNPDGLLKVGMPADVELAPGDGGPGEIAAARGAGR